MLNAIQVLLGNGQVAIEIFVDNDGKRGLMFTETGQAHAIGAEVTSETRMHFPKSGELYIKCLNRESALVLRDMVSKLVEDWQKPTYDPAHCECGHHFAAHQHSVIMAANYAPDYCAVSGCTCDKLKLSAQGELLIKFYNHKEFCKLCDTNTDCVTATELKRAIERAKTEG